MLLVCSPWLKHHKWHLMQNEFSVRSSCGTRVVDFCWISWVTFFINVGPVYAPKQPRRAQTNLGKKKKKNKLGNHIKSRRSYKLCEISNIWEILNKWRKILQTQKMYAISENLSNLGKSRKSQKHVKKFGKLGKYQEISEKSRKSREIQEHIKTY